TDINILAKAFNQVLKANAKISVYEMRGILGDENEVVYPLGSIEGSKGEYIDNYSIFIATKLKDFQENMGGTTISIFGYKSEEDARKANIKVTYTPAYGGSQKANPNGISINKAFAGSGIEIFKTNLFGVSWGDSIWKKQNNGIYKFEDMHNKYIKPTYLHLKLP
uniref:hypothetical protein n=2 Tax=Campylobacter lari TaxID=201 RepID=UPI003AF4608F